MPEIADITPLAVLALVIILTDRWIIRIFRVLIKHLERRELADQQLLLSMLGCAESLSAIQESLSFLSLPEDDRGGKLEAEI